MSFRNQLSQKLIDGYFIMLERVHSLLEKLDQKAAPALQQAIAEAKQTANRLLA